jgi:hypothetical protein
MLQALLDAPKEQQPRQEDIDNIISKVNVTLLTISLLIDFSQRKGKKPAHKTAPQA